MKIVITGSLGNISKPLTIELVKKGHHVTVISSKAERQKDIETLGAKAAIGTMEDADFLTATFKGVDVVYVMETLAVTAFFDPNIDVVDAINKIGENYKQAIKHSGVKHVVHLSSIGAHTNKDNGLLAMHYNVENILRELPSDVSIKFMRPVGFYTYFFTFIPLIKNQSIIVANFGGDFKEPWVSPLDIADFIAEEMEKPFVGRTIQYIASEEISTNEVAKILGEAIGKPDLKWVVIPDEQMENNMIAIGMNPQTAKGMVITQGSRTRGLYDDYNQHKPKLGKVKLKDFAKEFAVVYNL